MANAAASLRLGCLSSAVTPAATIGNAGMSQSFCAIAEDIVLGAKEIRSCISRSPLHPVHLVEIGGIGVAIDGDDEAQSHGSLGRGHGDREDGKHHAGERF